MQALLLEGHLRHDGTEEPSAHVSTAATGAGCEQGEPPPILEREEASSVMLCVLARSSSVLAEVTPYTRGAPLL